MKSFHEQRVESNMQQQAAVAQNLHSLAFECPGEAAWLMRAAEMQQRVWEFLEEKMAVLAE